MQKTHSNEEKAKQYFEKQIESKIKGGYVEVTQENDDEGEPSTKRAKTSQKQQYPCFPLKAILEFGKESAYYCRALLVRSTKTIVAGNDRGEVIECRYDASNGFKVVRKWQLGTAIQSVLEDGQSLLAATCTGAIFELTRSTQRFVCQLKNISNIEAIGIYNGCAAVSDTCGNISLFDGLFWFC